MESWAAAKKNFPPNEVGRIAQHVRKGEGRNQGKDQGRIAGQLRYEISDIKVL